MFDLNTVDALAITPQLCFKFEQLTVTFTVVTVGPWDIVSMSNIPKF